MILEPYQLEKLYEYQEVKMFTLIQCTPTRGDCTAGYEVDLDKEYTLQEFIDAILTNKKDEWGEIKIAKRKEVAKW